MSASPPEVSGADGVRGERGAALVHAARGMQSRVSSVLAAGLMIALGLSALTWYYAHALTRQTHARRTAQSTVAGRAQGEMPLPELGRIDPPPASAPAAERQSATVVAPADLPLAEAPARVAPDAGAAGAPPPKSPVELAHERRLTGMVFTRAQGSPGAPGTTRQASAADGAGAAPDVRDTAAGAPRPADRGAGDISALLQPGVTAAAAAQLLPDVRFLLPKGAFIDCTLETAIDSTLPGMTTCVTASDTFSADGTIVLLERGTKLVGETRGQVQQGQARVFVVWTQARTPAGVIVPLDSPGTDELGRSGLPGQVQRHFWQRFGAAMLVSLVDGAVQAGVQASSRSGGAVIYAPSASQDVLTEVLKDTLHVAPTVVKKNGDRIQVLVARNIDFRSVYELRTPVTGR